ncbi:hypothetical protein [Burkholderia seminalis]|uniref:hypothetical protein n=1 Tax=Burkholderia seminalis TaxID=488731 RepID=UPI001452E9AA|nr:hypothetical protein [Burkholderia seminalis]MCA8430025.1 hypothetical protein [Burkholderia seminalis]VWB15749.1 hypothetical protein BSE24067_00559 [Burkholderia seminalis]
MTVSSYAIVENGVVINIVLWDGKAEWAAPDNCQVVAATAGAEVGGTYDGKAFTPVPVSQKSISS